MLLFILLPQKNNLLFLRLLTIKVLFLVTSLGFVNLTEIFENKHGAM